MLLQGTLARPRLAATLRSPRLFLGDEGLGALEARLTGTGDGRVLVDGRCLSGRVDLQLAGHAYAAPPHEADLRLALRSTSLDPFLRVLRSSCRRGWRSSRPATCASRDRSRGRPSSRRRRRFPGWSC